MTLLPTVSKLPELCYPEKLLTRMLTRPRWAEVETWAEHSPPEARDDVDWDDDDYGWKDITRLPAQLTASFAHGGLSSTATHREQYSHSAIGAVDRPPPVGGCADPEQVQI